MSLLSWIVCVVFVILVIDSILRRMRLNAYVKDLPQISSLVLLPNLWQTKTSTELFQIFEKVVNSCDGLFSIWVGTKLVIHCDDPVNMKTILMSKNCLDKPYYYRQLSACGDGIFTAQAHDWRVDRKNINAVFTLSILNSFEPIFNRKFFGLAKSLERFVNQPTFDITEEILGCNFNTVLDSSFRYDYEGLLGSNREYISKLARFREIWATRSSWFFLHLNFIYRFTRLYAEEKKISEYFSTIASKVVSHALKIRNAENNGLDNDCVDAKPMILIDKLLDLEEKGLMDRQRVIDQINTFIGGGTDSSSITVLNTLLLLAMNQSVQDRVYDELRTNVANVDYIDFDTLTKLEYLDRVLKESMRLLPIIYIIARETDADIKLAECTAPKGTMLVLNLWKMHRSEKIWGPTARTFDPDRFLPDEVAQRHPFSYIPFSVGPRNCIGHKSAKLSTKLMLCHLLLKYKFTTSAQMNDLSIKFELLLKLNNKYMFNLQKRCVE